MSDARAKPVIMDGRALAERDVPELAARARAVLERRGRPPRVAIVAFVDDGATPLFVERKVRACAAAGVEALPVILPSSTSSDAAREWVQRLGDDALDAIFLEFPFPPAIDGDAIMTAVPEALDVDVMTEGRVRRYLERAQGPAPLTVEAALRLLDGYDVSIEGLDGVVVADSSPFTVMFREALARRGARMRPLVPPSSAGEAVGSAQLVVVAAGRAGLVDARALRAGAVAIDVGYFNPERAGDIDTSGGIAHLAAIAPVPGAIGPMTVSMLVRRTIEMAESSIGSTS